MDSVLERLAAAESRLAALEQRHEPPTVALGIEAALQRLAAVVGQPLPPPKPRP
jgi:hypothetical protein